MKLKQTQRTAFKLKPKLMTKIRLASFMELPETGFFGFIREMENDPVFKELSSSVDASRKVISCRRFPGTRFAMRFSELREEVNRDKGSLDVEPLIARQKDIVAVIREIGEEKFEKLFLYNEEHVSDKEIVERYGIAEKDIEKIRVFVNELLVRAEFYHPPAMHLESRINYCKIAAVEQGEDGNFVIRFFSSRYGSGKYVVDAEKLDALKKQKVFAAEKLAEIDRLLKKIELINARKSTLYQILRRVTERQGAYLKTGDERSLVPCTQRELAAEIGTDESFVSRSLFGRTVETPQHEEKPLAFFFPSKKDIRKNIIKDIIAASPRSLTDNEIRRILSATRGIEVSRRTVNACRRASAAEDSR